MKKIIILLTLLSACSTTSSITHNQGEIVYTGVKPTETLTANLCKKTGLNLILTDSSKQPKELKESINDNTQSFDMSTMGNSLYVRLKEKDNADTTVRLLTKDNKLYIVNIHSIDCSEKNSIKALYIQDQNPRTSEQHRLESRMQTVEN